MLRKGGERGWDFSVGLPGAFDLFTWVPWRFESLRRCGWRCLEAMSWRLANSMLSSHGLATVRGVEEGTRATARERGWVHGKDNWQNTCFSGWVQGRFWFLDRSVTMPCGR